MKSWKTTLCGVVAIIGGTLVQFFPEYPLAAKIGGALAAAATGIGLLFARDNNVTSEQVGAGNADSGRRGTPPSDGGDDGRRGTPPSDKLGMFLALGLAAAVAAVGVVTLTGCNTPQQTKAFNSIYSVHRTTLAAYDAYLAGVVAGTVKTNDVPKISKAFNTFQAATLVALDGVQFNTNALAPGSLVVEAGDLINLINQVTKE
jgi:hypothetical protein